MINFKHQFFFMKSKTKTSPKWVTKPNDPGGCPAVKTCREASQKLLGKGSFNHKTKRAERKHIPTVRTSYIMMGTTNPVRIRKKFGFRFHCGCAGMRSDIAVAVCV